jgi:hypothetical protein
MWTRKWLCGEEVGCEDDLCELYVDLKHIMSDAPRLHTCCWKFWLCKQEHILAFALIPNSGNKAE